MQTARVILLSFLLAFTLTAHVKADDNAISGNLGDTTRILLLNQQAYEFYMNSLNNSCLASSSLALHYTNLDGSKISIVHSHLDLGTAYLKNSEPDNALEQFFIALELSHEENYRTTEVLAAMNIAKIHLGENQPAEALAWLKKAEKTAPKPLPVLIKDLYLNIAEAYAKLGDYKSAFINLQLHNQVKD